MVDYMDRSTKINLLKEGVVKKLCEVLDKSTDRGWRKLGEIVGKEKRLKVSSDDIEICSLKVLELEGSPSRMLLRLMGERGCTLGHLMDYLQTLANPDAVQCLKPSPLQIVIQPQSLALISGHNLRLSCHAVGKSPVQYQWFKGKEEILNVDQEHHARYRCEIVCGSEKMWTNEVDVVVDDFYAIAGGSNDFFLNSVPEQLHATDKVALLIGNLSYKNHPQLKAPMVDVYDLTNLLRQLDFKVVSLLDLTESEMRNAVDEFLLLLHKGVYGLLYYAGHGYENYGNSFMVPVDAPNPYRSANCLCVQSILKLMQEKETGLNVFLLDMCRKRNIHDDSTTNIVLRVTANIVFGYATCQDAEAFELSSSGFTNGVFVKFLKKRLLDDEKITVVLDKVAEDMGQFDATKGKQALEIRSSLSERRALTDSIMPSDSPDLAHAHSRQWAKAHELPESMSLLFDCGAQIKLGFAAEFSNVLVIYTHITKKPEDMSVCQAHVTDFSQDLDVDPKEMNRETPEETGTYFLSGSLPQHCLYTRLSSLQKLREELVFSVCLQGTFSAMEDDPVHWNKAINIGKPLIARLDLHRAMRRNSCLQTCLMPHSPSQSPCHSPRPDHFLHHHHGLHQAQDPNRLSPQPFYMDVYEHHQGAVNLGQCHSEPLHHSSGGLSSSPGRFSIPIEASDDINELQTAFINSLQL
ncbi:mucosa-associated lymphoid tissue lymphoma translocation protein 1 isoform X6 [Cynoglossus semilaevis]|uniref:mucosa-associated lymphoid tissue lymphoma translocation protein 1 isoform X6 n=1 Tax=Cynoglossus semilaevis TaxID=244447 RepID=UPI000D62F957|nr:mucosa-associated lymphoid tissue lymphoma translocation protein 1 isoform X6 [Cynoglossus semilaevis]